MADSAALLVDEVLPDEPLRQWVLSVPYALRFLFAASRQSGRIQPACRVAVRANQRNKRERLCRTISCPALSEQRLSLSAAGKVRYQLKTPYTNGTTHVVFEPLDFLAKRAALVPRPRVNLTRYHGVFAPNSAQRALVTRAGRSRAQSAKADARTPAKRRSAMRWAQRLKRVSASTSRPARAAPARCAALRASKTRW